MEREQLAKRIQLELIDSGVKNVTLRKDKDGNCYVLIHEHCIYPCTILIDKELFGKVFFDMMCPVNCATDLTIKLCRILDFSLKICEPFHRSPYSGDLAWGKDAETLMLKNLPHYFKRRKEISGLSYIGLIESSIGFKYETIRHHNI